MNNVALCIKITAHPGKRDDLAEAILEGAAVIGEHPDCLLFSVNASTTEPDVLVMYEIFANEEVLAALPADERVKATIARSEPLIAAREATMLKPVGGYNVPG